MGSGILPHHMAGMGRASHLTRTSRMYVAPRSECVEEQVWYWSNFAIDIWFMFDVLVRARAHATG